MNVYQSGTPTNHTVSQTSLVWRRERSSGKLHVSDLFESFKVNPVQLARISAPARNQAKQMFPGQTKQERLHKTWVREAAKLVAIKAKDLHEFWQSRQCSDGLQAKVTFENLVIGCHIIKTYVQYVFPSS